MIGSTPSNPHPSLPGPAANLIGGEWKPIAGADLRSMNPARPSEVVWSGTPDREHLAKAVECARSAFPAWSNTPFDDRAKVLRKFKTLCLQHADSLATLIRDETGKPMWDARAEADLLASKVDITLDSGPTSPLSRVSGYELQVTQTRIGKTWFRPHGVMAVIGPFNFPAHLPNGHIVPALAMGNTIVLKPSDKSPAVGQFLAWLLDSAFKSEGAPRGVVNLVHGGADIASALTAHDDIDGILFTGSWPVGRRIMQANLDRPGRILALEMGGNNPAVILHDADLPQAVIECVRSAFISCGQRCTCTRRLIVHHAVAAKVLPAVCKAAASLIIGSPDAPHPVFMGPLISEAARQSVLNAQLSLQRAGGETLVPCTIPDVPATGWYITPGVMRVDRFTRGDSGGCGADLEVFGPFLRVAIARDLDDAIEQANATDFGLAAAIFTKDPAAADRFRNECRAGCINENCGTAGASSRLPFGGLGKSGNHRPAGAFSLDYCAYPVAGMVERGTSAALATGMRFDDAWL